MPRRREGFARLEVFLAGSAGERARLFAAPRATRWSRESENSHRREMPSTAAGLAGQKTSSRLDAKEQNQFAEKIMVENSVGHRSSMGVPLLRSKECNVPA